MSRLRGEVRRGATSGFSRETRSTASMDTNQLRIRDATPSGGRESRPARQHDALLNISRESHLGGVDTRLSHRRNRTLDRSATVPRLLRLADLHPVQAEGRDPVGLRGHLFELWYSYPCPCQKKFYKLPAVLICSTNSHILDIPLCCLSHTKMASVIKRGGSRGTSSHCSPLPSHDSSRMSYHACRRANEFCEKVLALRLRLNVTT